MEKKLKKKIVPVKAYIWFGGAGFVVGLLLGVFVWLPFVMDNYNDFSSLFVGWKSAMAVATGKDCGGSVPCSCGDRVITDTLLDSGKDPVVTSVCPSDGLMVASNVTLDLGGNTIRGSMVGEGIRVEQNASNVRIKNGTVKSFYQGVKGLVVSNVTVSNLLATKNKYFGIVLRGNDNVIEDSVAMENGGRGMRIKGNNGRLLRNHFERNGGYGSNVIGDNAIIQKNIGIANKSDCIHVDGANNLFEENECYDHKHRPGIMTDDAKNATIRRNIMVGNNTGLTLFSGSGHIVEDNIFRNNNTHGANIKEVSNIKVERNDADGNGSSGIYLSGNKNFIADNNADNNGREGIYVKGKSNIDGGGNTAVGNKKTDCTIDGTPCH